MHLRDDGDKPPFCFTGLPRAEGAPCVRCLGPPLLLRGPQSPRSSPANIEKLPKSVVSDNWLDPLSAIMVAQDVPMIVAAGAEMALAPLSPIKRVVGSAEHSR